MYHFIVEFIKILTGVNSEVKLNLNIKTEIRTTNPILIIPNIDQLSYF